MCLFKTECEDVKAVHFRFPLRKFLRRKGEVGAEPRRSSLRDIPRRRRTGLQPTKSPTWSLTFHRVRTVKSSGGEPEISSCTHPDVPALERQEVPEGGQLSWRFGAGRVLAEKARKRVNVIQSSLFVSVL